MGESVEERLQRVERLLEEVLDGEIKRIVHSYFRIVELALRFGRLSIQDILPGVEGDERDIVEALLRLGEANLTRIAEEVRVERGHASRNTIKKRLVSLERKGIVVRGEDGLYRVSDEVIRRWLGLLGIGRGEGKK